MQQQQQQQQGPASRYSSYPTSAAPDSQAQTQQQRPGPPMHPDSNHRLPLPYPQHQQHQQQHPASQSTLPLPPPSSMGFHTLPPPPNMPQTQGSRMSLPLPFPPGSSTQSYPRTLPLPYERPSDPAPYGSSSSQTPYNPQQPQQSSSSSSYDYSSYRSNITPSYPPTTNQLPYPSQQPQHQSQQPVPPSRAQFEQSASAGRHEFRTNQSHVTGHSTNNNTSSYAPHQHHYSQPQSLYPPPPPPQQQSFPPPLPPQVTSMQQVNSGSAGGKRRGSTAVNLAPQQSPPVYHHQPQQQPFQQPVTTELITPTLSPESTTRPGTAGPGGAVNPGSQGRHPFPTKQTTPYTLHTTPVQTCAPPNTSQYHSAQKHFLSSLYLKDDPHDCLLAFHRFVKHDDENNNGGVTLAQLINMPLLGTTETCLHVAIKWGKPVTVKALLRLGANPRLRSGFTCQVVPCPGPMGQGAAGKKRQAQSVSPPPELNVTSSGRVTRKRKINYNEIVSSGKEGSSGGGGGGDEEGSDRARGCCLGCLRIVEAAGSVNNSGVPPALTPLQLMALYPGEWGDVDSLLLQDVVKGLWVSLMDRDSMGRTCLHLALGKKKHSGSSSNSEDDDDSGASNASAFVECIVEAIENLDSEMTNGKQMLCHFLDAVDCEGNTALHLACLAGDLDSVKALVRPDSKEDVVTATIGIINMFSQTPLDLVVEMALETVRKLGLYEDEMLTCLRSVKYLEDEGLFRRELVCKLGDGSLMMGEKEELQFRVRRMMLVEGVDGFSIQQLVKLREIARVLLSANGNSDVSSLEDWFDAVLLNRL